MNNYVEFYKTHRCDFNPENHTYTLVDLTTGEAVKQLKSVTRLLADHNLKPDFSMVDAAVLNAKAVRGTLIHKEIEEYIKYGEAGMTSEFQDFIRLCAEKHLLPTESEFIVYDENYAGTIDIGAETPDDKTALCDTKTSATLHKSSLQWQLSIYARLARKMGRVVDLLGGFHLNDDSKYVDVDELPSDEIDKLIAADLAGEMYAPRSIAIAPDMLARIVELDNVITALDTQKKAAQAQYDELKSLLLQAMKDNGVKSYDSERVKVTYIEATTRDGVDVKALKADAPDIYEKYKKASVVKESIKITVRAEK